MDSGGSGPPRGRRRTTDGGAPLVPRLTRRPRIPADTPRGTVRVTDFHAAARRRAPADPNCGRRHGPGPDALRAADAFLLRPCRALGAQARGAHGRRRRTRTTWFDTACETYGKALTTYADFTVAPGDRIAFTISWEPSHKKPPALPEPEQALEATEDFWRDWVDQCTYHGPYREAVVRSLITLKALTYAPTGGIVAAPTTSLPEEIGGVRNWDYRYTWLRDAAITLSSLLRTGYRDEARAWREWLLRAVAGDPENLQIMYGIAGERELGEAELDWLPGYENSGPVRVGNGARAPAPAGRLRRGHRGPAPGPHDGAVAQRLRLAPPAEADPLPGGPLGPAGRGHLGGPRPAPPLRALQGHGLGRRRPHDQAHRVR